MTENDRTAEMKHRFETPDSDAIVSVEYDDIIEEVTITLRKRVKLVYGRFPMSAYREFEAAASAGRFFNTRIRWNGPYPFLGEISL
jgi:hypothetical protein